MILRPGRLRRSDAFTLIEVMVALVVFTLGILGMTGLFVSVAQTNRGTNNRSRAIELLHQKVEQLESTPYSQLAAGSEQETVGNVGFDLDWTVQSNTPVANVSRIDLTAEWSERGQTFSVNTATIRSAN